MTIFIKSENKVITLNAREIAPARATQTMFGDAEQVSGGLAIAVPGELKGYWELHKRYGVLKWADLVRPTIKLATEGHVVSDYLAGILKSRETVIRASKSLARIYINPKTRKPYVAKDRIKRPELAKTLEMIAREGGVDQFYGGKFTEEVAAEIQAKHGGIISVEDFRNYRVTWGKPVAANLTGGRKLYAHPLPGSGDMLVFMMNTLHEYLPKGKDPVSFVRMAEAMKFAYAFRTKLGDPRSNQEVAKVK